MAEFIRVDREGKTARVVMTRPEVHNAFNEVMIAEVTEAFRSLGSDVSVRTVVLAGEGKSFSAGADVNWMKRMVDYTVDENIEDAMTMAHMLRAIRECPKPTIARVHGAAFGGGVGLTAACDMGVAVEQAVFCLSEVKLGIIPAVISPYVLEKIGLNHARRYALTAEKFAASDAYDIGLISDVAADEDAMDDWIARVAKAIEGNGPTAVAACKSVLFAAWDAPWEKVPGLTAQRIAKQRVSDEGQDGLKAFLEKRNPGWIEE